MIRDTCIARVTTKVSEEDTSLHFSQWSYNQEIIDDRLYRNGSFYKVFASANITSRFVATKKLLLVFSGVVNTQPALVLSFEATCEWVFFANCVVAYITDLFINIACNANFPRF